MGVTHGETKGSPRELPSGSPGFCYHQENLLVTVPVLLVFLSLHLFLSIYHYIFNIFSSFLFVYFCRYIYLCLFIIIYLIYFLVSYLYISTRHFYDLLLYSFVFLWRALCIFPEGVDNRVFGQIQKKYTRKSDIILTHKFYYILKCFFLI